MLMKVLDSPSAYCTHYPEKILFLQAGESVCYFPELKSGFPLQPHLGFGVPPGKTQIRHRACNIAVTGKHKSHVATFGNMRGLVQNLSW